MQMVKESVDDAMIKKQYKEQDWLSKWGHQINSKINTKVVPMDLTSDRGEWK